MGVLIKNGLIYDGKGQAPFKKDILIKGKTIASIGKFSKKDADIVLDAEDGMVSPGFVDVNSGIDHYLNLFSDPHSEKYLLEGITTAIGGTNGSSLAPAYSARLKSVRKWGVGEKHKVNVNWRSFKEFINTLSQNGLGVNFASLVGHSTIRREIVGEELRDLTAKELQLFKKILRDAFKEGALGLSFGLDYAHSKNISYHEVEELAKVVKEEKKLFSSDIRDADSEENAFKSFKNLLDIVEKTGVNAEVSRLQPIASAKSSYEKIKEVLEERSKNLPLNIDCNTYEGTIVPFYQFLPDWAKRGNLENMNALISGEHHKDKILEHLKTVVRKPIIFGHMPQELKFIENKSLKELAEKKGGTQAEVFLSIMKMSSLKGVCLYQNVSKDILHKFLALPTSFIGSNGLHLLSSDSKPFADFLMWAKDTSGLPLEKAVAKVTSLPAKKFGIKDRGVIEENKFADIVIMKNGIISDVIVNGRIAIRNGEPQ